MKNTFLAISSAGPKADPSKVTREQLFWDEHAAFIDQLISEPFIMMGGPLVDEAEIPHGALLIVTAQDENEVSEKLKNDPWLEKGILKLERVSRWQIFIDARKYDRSPLALVESNPKTHLANGRCHVERSETSLVCFGHDVALKFIRDGKPGLADFVRCVAASFRSE
jgi:uncharacterized protein